MAKTRQAIRRARAFGRNAAYLSGALVRAARGDKEARFRVASAAASYLYPPFTYSDYGRAWIEDDAFRAALRPFDVDPHSLDRKYFLRSLLPLADGLPGDTAECGVFRGASSWLIAGHFGPQGKTHHAFDSFAGLSRPGETDGTFFAASEMAIPEQQVRAALAGQRVRFHAGWIPERFPEVADCRFCFVHIDVDLYQPTRDTLEFFYPRLVAGGIILCDDYGFTTCPGAKRACDEFFADKPEVLVPVPTGQAFAIRADTTTA